MPINIVSYRIVKAHSEKSVSFKFHSLTYTEH
jgi:hypothetical protein